MNKFKTIKRIVYDRNPFFGNNLFEIGAYCLSLMFFEKNVDYRRWFYNFFHFTHNEYANGIRTFPDCEHFSPNYKLWWNAVNLLFNDSGQTAQEGSYPRKVMEIFFEFDEGIVYQFCYRRDHETEDRDIV